VGWAVAFWYCEKRLGGVPTVTASVPVNILLYSGPLLALRRVFYFENLVEEAFFVNELRFLQLFRVAESCVAGCFTHFLGMVIS